MFIARHQFNPSPSPLPRAHLLSFPSHTGPQDGPGGLGKIGRSLRSSSSLLLLPSRGTDAMSAAREPAAQRRSTLNADEPAALATKQLHAHLSRNGIPSRIEIGMISQDLFPAHSVLGRLIAVTAQNTDLPACASALMALPLIGSAMVREGIAAEVEPGVVYPPNVDLVLLTSGGDTQALYRSIVGPSLAACNLAPLPDLLTAASLFQHLLFASAKKIASPTQSQACVFGTAPPCGGLLVRPNGAQWMQALNTDREQNLLRSALGQALDGLPVEGWLGKKELARTLPVYLSACITSDDELFFDHVTERDLLHGLLSRFLIARIRNRPTTRRSIYGVAGVAQVAADFAQTWRNILAGPRLYRPTRQARSYFDQWSHPHLSAATSYETTVRRHTLAVWSYATIFAALLDGRDSIELKTMEIATRLVESHLDTLRESLENFVGVSAWHREMLRIVAWLRNHPGASRKTLLSNRKGCPAAELDGFLPTIAQLFAGTALGDHARDLLLKS